MVPSNIDIVLKSGNGLLTLKMTPLRESMPQVISLEAEQTNIPLETLKKIRKSRWILRCCEKGASGAEAGLVLTRKIFL